MYINPLRVVYKALIPPGETAFREFVDSTIRHLPETTKLNPSHLRKFFLSTGAAGTGVAGTSLLATALEPLTTATYNLSGLISFMPSAALGMVHALMNAMQLRQNGLGWGTLIKRVSTENIAPAAVSGAAGFATFYTLSKTLDYSALSALQNPGSLSMDSALRYFGAYVVAGAVYLGLNRAVRKFWRSGT